MKRLGGPAGGAAAFALTAGLAVDEGGYDAVSYDRALLGLCAVALVAAVLWRWERPGVPAAALLGALGPLTGWTAASWLWSESPPRALRRAPRVALYAVAAAVVVLAGRRVAVMWIAGGVAAAATLVAIWNLVVVRGVDGPGRRRRARRAGRLRERRRDPVRGRARAPAEAAAARAPRGVPLAADLAKQASTGALAALGAALLAYLFMIRPRLRPLVAVAVVVGLALARSHSAATFAASTGVSRWTRRTRIPSRARVPGHSPTGGSRSGACRSRRRRRTRYLETLAELGPVGLALLLAGLAVPLAAAVRIREPALAAALVAYDVGAAVDFHWELAGVTVPVVLLGATAVVHASKARTRPRRALSRCRSSRR